MEFGFVDRLGVGFFDCNEPLTTFDSTFTPPTMVRFSITDCEHPRSHAYFMVRADASVKEIRNF